MRYSVVIPVYNKADTVGDAISSILSQKPKYVNSFLPYFKEKHTKTIV